MGECNISGLETNHKHNGHYVHRDVFLMARMLAKEEECTITEAFEKIANRLVNDINDRINNGDVPSE